MRAIIHESKERGDRIAVVRVVDDADIIADMTATQRAPLPHEAMMIDQEDMMCDPEDTKHREVMTTARTFHHLQR
jgi:hypothetical protein